MTNKQKQAAAEPSPCDDKVVSAYLRAHPDFFTYHTDLLAEINVPHHTDGAVSLVERQVSVLRDQNRQLRRRLVELVETARDNDRLLDNLQHFTLDLLGVEHLEALPTRVVASVTQHFNADHVALQVFAPGFQERDAAEGTLGNVLRAGRPVCGKPKPTQLIYLFGDAADAVGSAALLPLGDGGELGILAIGSADDHRFHPEMGKLFLGHIGAAVTAAVEKLSRREA